VAPWTPGEKLVYRVIYRIDDELQQVTVVGVFSRADAYRARW